MAILWRSLLLLSSWRFCPFQVSAQVARLTVVELNVENLFDTHHDSLDALMRTSCPRGGIAGRPLATGGSSTASGQTVIAC